MLLLGCCVLQKTLATRCSPHIYICISPHDSMQLMQRDFGQPACLIWGSQDKISLTKVTMKANCMFAALNSILGLFVC